LLNNEPAYEKTRRNELCPCGSGKKYKKCCLDNPAMAGTFIYTDLDMLSNKVNELIKDGRLAEAEDTCRILMKKYLLVAIISFPVFVGSIYKYFLARKFPAVHRILTKKEAGFQATARLGTGKGRS